ncbi:hypothetical protein BS50DRAFT_382523 [Corynespora cassiicola Philippines]|uniref:Uncharacterized protein n=1 Tax=Corynespora cassiicola Philippines TaxID=1448308 RepID=A0A2T2NPV6_CORCC|nr:hypothetical protein BS50DRAFT_382523 [Corynespora cassiicola Philippines]
MSARYNSGKPPTARPQAGLAANSKARGQGSASWSRCQASEGEGTPGCWVRRPELHTCRRHLLPHPVSRYGCRAFPTVAQPQRALPSARPGQTHRLTTAQLAQLAQLAPFWALDRRRLTEAGKLGDLDSLQSDDLHGPPPRLCLWPRLSCHACAGGGDQSVRDPASRPALKIRPTLSFGGNASSRILHTRASTSK